MVYVALPLFVFFIFFPNMILKKNYMFLFVSFYGRLDENDLVGTCTHNRDAAAAVGRKDLVQARDWLFFFFFCEIV